MMKKKMKVLIVFIDLFSFRKTIASFFKILHSSRFSYELAHRSKQVEVKLARNAVLLGLLVESLALN
ncbi:hypothetical protein KFK09_013782 [Dendrobium nobile]|uniref:Uncharacterized protein n=1 Tax=Dendrobium nobile TaxID=94219 RepID=A0A8T3B9U8_DENNO|nr:hypothetical protein KFK09_013782 [Dendrobium nobile]